jgi:hypothetical protein
VLQRGEIEIALNIIVPDQPAGPSNQPRNVNNTCLRPVLQRGEIEIAPNIIVPDQPTGPSNQPQNSNNTPNQHFNDDGYDDLCVEVLKNVEDAGLSEPLNQIHTTNITPNEHFHEDGYDEMCMEVLKHAENTGLCDVTCKIFFYIRVYVGLINFFFFYIR